jgi:hypothetical protein
LRIVHATADECRREHHCWLFDAVLGTAGVKWPGAKGRRSSGAILHACVTLLVCLPLRIVLATADVNAKRKSLLAVRLQCLCMSTCLPPFCQ